MTLKTWRTWLLIFGLCTFMGLLSFSTFYTEDLLDGGRTPPTYFLINELTGAYATFVLLPFLLWFIGRFPFTRENWTAMLPLHLAGSIVFGICHTTLMSLSRLWLYPLAGLTPYQVGDVLYRYLMEYQKQLLVYGGIVLAVHLIRAYRDRQDKEKEAAALALRTAELQTRLADARLETLRNQLHPHFLFNTLNMISSLMYEDVAQADRMIARLSQLLRASLEQAGRPKVELHEELSFLDAYLEIMRCRFPEQIRFELDLDSAPSGALVPGFLLQPLVENAIKYGRPSDGRPLLLELHIQASEGELDIELTDNGRCPEVGAGAQIQEGYGLSNTQQRLAQLYPGRHVFDYGHRPDAGFAVRIRLPLEVEAGAAAPAAPVAGPAPRRIG
ncbi:MAG: histidine kinase [Acidobacteriota bacterium]